MLALLPVLALAQTAPSLEELEAGCAEGDGAACTVVGLLLAEGVRVAPDRERATVLLGQQCDLGDVRACRGVGLLLLDGLPPEDDPVKGAGLLEAACVGQDDWPSCARVGDVLADNHELGEAVRYWAYACRGGFLYGCSRMAEDALDPKKPWKSTDAVLALQDMCARGEPYACDLLDRKALPRQGPAKK